MVKYDIRISESISLKNIKKLEVFGHGFFQDMLTLMHQSASKYITRQEVLYYLMNKDIREKKYEAFGYQLFQDILTLMNYLNVQYVTKQEAIHYRDHLLQPYKKKKSGRRTQYGTSIPGARPIGIKLKGEPCKGCKDKES